MEELSTGLEPMVTAQTGKSLKRWGIRVCMWDGTVGASAFVLLLRVTRFRVRCAAGLTGVLF